MLDRVKFAMELANELNRNSFSSITPVMFEDATAYSVDGISCGKLNLLADVFSCSTGYQYSVKSYKDKVAKLYISGEIEEDRQYTDFIIERRVSGVSDPNGDPSIIMDEVIQDIYDNEQRSLKHYGASYTETVLIGFYEDDDYYYFRLTEVPFEYNRPEYTQIKYFTDRSKNYQRHDGNRSSIAGYNSDGILLYEWVHPNNQTYTRCLKKRYCLDDYDSFYFKIKKQQYNRPSDTDLMGMIYI